MAQPGNASVDTLLAKMQSEHPGMPLDAISSLLQYEDIRAKLTQPDIHVEELADLMLAKPDGQIAATWLTEMGAHESIQVVPKLKVIATTFKLLNLIPEQMRSQIESMVGNLNPTSMPAAPPAPAGKPDTAGGASRAMDMINQVMNSGMLQQMQELAKDDADDIDTMKEDVKQLKAEVQILKKLVNTIISRVPSKSEGHAKRKSKR